jgi:hypothetical protein
MPKRELIEPTKGDKRYIRRDEQVSSTRRPTSANPWSPTGASMPRR